MVVLHLARCASLATAIATALPARFSLRQLWQAPKRHPDAMKKKRHRPEQMIEKLRQADVELSQGVRSFETPRPTSSNLCSQRIDCTSRVA